MNTIATRRPLWPRIKARVKAALIRRELESLDRESKALMEALELIPRDLDTTLDNMAVLRVQLAIAERES